jgi:hypothetical protein
MTAHREPAHEGVVIVQWPAGVGPAPWEPGGSPWEPYEPDRWPAPGEPFPIEEDPEPWWER